MIARKVMYTCLILNLVLDLPRVVYGYMEWYQYFTNCVIIQEYFYGGRPPGNAFDTWMLIWFFNRSDIGRSK